MKELVVVGFADRNRALEILAHLQRLHFEWSRDLDDAVAVEVENDGRLRLLHSDLLDAATGWEDGYHWKAFLSVIVPLPHVPSSSSADVSSEVYTINVEAHNWLADSSLDRDFVRDAAALLQPGNSAILARIQDWQSAMSVLCGYSQIVLHTSVVTHLLDE